MKKNILMSAALLTLFAHQVQAETASSGNSVQIYGLMDAGVTYVSNSSGSKNVKFDDGIYVPNLLGFKGSEDLGGGVHAIFNLVDQYSLGTGSIIQGNNEIFGRNAYVGLESEEFGTVTLGNQYDFMDDALFFDHDDAAIYVGGLYNFRDGPFSKIAIPGDPPYAGSFNWDRMADASVTNSIKYASPKFNGFSFGALYGFGGVAGSFGSNSTVSAGINYGFGTFGMGAAYTDVKSSEAGLGQINVMNWGVGAHYAFGNWTTSALVTAVRNSANGGAIAEGEVGALYRFNPAWSLGADYMYMKGNSYLNNNHAHQVTATLSDQLSKRTAVYVESVYQRTNAGAQALINGMLNPTDTSSGPSQFLARVGLTTRF